jgi:uncharacterized protein
MVVKKSQRKLIMKNAIIIHGMPSKEEYYSEAYPSASNFQWLPWLQKQLIIRDIKADTPEMPHAYNPEYSLWKKEFERFDITSETILVGHSCGGGFLLRWLSQHPEIKVGKVVLVAPWLDVEHELITDFFNFEIDPKLAAQTKGLTIFYSDDDTSDIQNSVTKIQNEIENIKQVSFHDYGHFVGENLRTNGFPELLEEILK